MKKIGSEKNEWTISLLDIKPDDNILEMGFGPGVGLDMVSKVVQGGKVVGIDYSEVMLEQARKNNKKSIQEGKVELKLADVNNLPDFDQSFDKVYAVNSIMFWDNPVQTLGAVRKYMKRDGILAITVQPFTKGATEDTAKELGEDYMETLEQAGYSDIKVELKSMKPVPAVCVIGVNK
nr:class I SAM-dependent methyltransferase [Thalassobacillus devorans]